MNYPGIQFSTVLFSLMLLCFSPVAVADMLIVPGTGDSQDLLRKLSKIYASKAATTVVVPESVGSSGGIRQIRLGQASLARVARRLSDKEESAGLEWKQFAYSPVVFAAHSDLEGVENLTSKQIEAIFTGVYRNWSQVGVGAGKIYVAQREMGDSSRTVLQRHFPLFSDSEQIVGKILYSTPEMVDVLDRYRGTIGYLPLSAVADSGVRPLQLDGVPPTLMNLESGDYPLAIPLAMVWKGDLSGPEAEFIDFLFSDEARSLMRRYGVVPVEGE